MKDYRVGVVAASAWGTGFLIHYFGVWNLWVSFLVLIPVLVTVAFIFVRRLNRDFYGTLAASCLAALLATVLTTQYNSEQNRFQEFLSLQEQGVVTVHLEETPVLVSTPWGSSQILTKGILVAAQGTSGAIQRMKVPVQLEGEKLSSYKRGQTIVGFARLSSNERYNKVAIRSVRAVRAESTFARLGNYVQDRAVQATTKLPPPSRALVTGSSVGKVVPLDSQTREGLKDASLIHLNVISGMHISIILYGLVVLRAKSVAARVAVTFMTLGVVLMVVGTQPSLLRASLMTSLLMVATILGRQPRPSLLLGVVTLFVTLTAPDIAYKLGFILSVTATWGVLKGSESFRFVRGLAEGKKHKQKTRILWQKILMKNGEVIVVSAFVQLATLPVVAAMQSWIPTWAILANLLVFPVVTPLVLSSLCMSITACFSVELARPLASLSGFFAKWVIAVADFVAVLPFRRIPVNLEMVLFPVFFLALIGWVARKTYQKKAKWQSKKNLLLPSTQ